MTSVDWSAGAIAGVRLARERLQQLESMIHDHAVAIDALEAEQRDLQSLIANLYVRGKICGHEAA